MANLIPIPDELQYLIEKRSGEEQRRSDRRDATAAAPETAQSENETQGLGSDARRTSVDRRQEQRRADDA